MLSLIFTYSELCLNLQPEIFARTTGSHWQKFYLRILFFVKDCTADTATFTALVKILSLENYYNTKIAGLGERFYRTKIFGYMV